MKSKIGLIFLCVISMLLVSGLVSAIPITINEVKVDGTELSPGAANRLDIERDQTFPVRVELTSTADLDDVEVEVFISGYEYNDRERISDSSHVFDMDANVTYIRKLELRLPPRVDEDDYRLRVLVTDRNGDELIQSYNLKLDVPRHSVTIDDVIFSPEGYVKAGRALLTTVRISNMGEKDEEGVRVRVAVPELGISASDYIDEVEKEGSGNDDEVTSEELYMRVPDCAKPGTYDVVIEVTYDEGFETETRRTVVEILPDEACSARPGSGSTSSGEESTPQTIINVGAVAQDVSVGVGGATYPITLTNGGSSSRTYSVNAVGAADWAATTITPTNTLVLGKGETETVYVYVSATKGTPAGQRMFSVSVSSGDKVLKQIPLTANVVKGQGYTGGVKRALEIGLVILVVLLVILGLIIGFNKLKGSEQDGSDESQTYY